MLFRQKIKCSGRIAYKGDALVMIQLVGSDGLNHMRGLKRKGAVVPKVTEVPFPRLLSLLSVGGWAVFRNFRIHAASQLHVT